MVGHPEGGRCVTVTYHGSIIPVHGTAHLVGDGDCPDCCDRDPWDPARRYRLRVEIEHLEGTSGGAVRPRREK